MAKPVEDTVYFKVTVRSYDRGDYWIAKTRETGIYTYGETRESAEDLSGEANEYLVRKMKQEGIRALKRFLKDKGIAYRLGGDDPLTAGKPQTACGGAVARSELARAA